MKKLFISIMSCSLLLGAAPVVEGDTSTIPYYIYNAANYYKLDIALLYALCHVESNCRPRAINHDDGTSKQKELGIKDKSYGLFQIKLSTAESLGFVSKDYQIVEIINKKGRLIKLKKTVNHTKELLDPETNTWYAAKLLRKLYDRYHSTNKVLSAYNAGHYIKANSDYVSKVLKQYAHYKIDKNY